MFTMAATTNDDSDDRRLHDVQNELEALCSPHCMHKAELSYVLWRKAEHVVVKSNLLQIPELHDAVVDALACRDVRIVRNIIRMLLEVMSPLSPSSLLQTDRRCPPTQPSSHVLPKDKLTEHQLLRYVGSLSMIFDDNNSMKPPSMIVSNARIFLEKPLSSGIARYFAMALRQLGAEHDIYDSDNDDGDHLECPPPIHSHSRSLWLDVLTLVMELLLTVASYTHVDASVMPTAFSLDDWSLNSMLTSAMDVITLGSRPSVGHVRTIWRLLELADIVEANHSKITKRIKPYVMSECCGCNFRGDELAVCQCQIAVTAPFVAFIRHRIRSQRSYIHKRHGLLSILLVGSARRRRALFLKNGKDSIGSIPKSLLKEIDFIIGSLLVNHNGVAVVVNLLLAIYNRVLVDKYRTMTFGRRANDFVDPTRVLLDGKLAYISDDVFSVGSYLLDLVTMRSLFYTCLNTVSKYLMFKAPGSIKGTRTSKVVIRLLSVLLCDTECILRVVRGDPDSVSEGAVNELLPLLELGNHESRRILLAFFTSAEQLLHFHNIFAIVSSLLYVLIGNELDDLGLIKRYHHKVYPLIDVGLTLVSFLGSQVTEVISNDACKFTCMLDSDMSVDLRAFITQHSADVAEDIASLLRDYPYCQSLQYEEEIDSEMSTYIELSHQTQECLAKHLVIFRELTSGKIVCEAQMKRKNSMNSLNVVPTPPKTVRPRTALCRLKGHGGLRGRRHVSFSTTMLQMPEAIHHQSQSKRDIDDDVKRSSSVTTSTICKSLNPFPVLPLTGTTLTCPISQQQTFPDDSIVHC